MYAGELRFWVYLWWRRTRERIILGVVWRLPRELVYWAAIRVGAHATTGMWGATDPSRVSFMEVLKRWETPNER